MIKQFLIISLFNVLFYLAHSRLINYKIFKKKPDQHNFNESDILPFGGFILIIILLIFNSAIDFNLIIFIIFLSILGFMSDNKTFENPRKRLLSIFLSTGLFSFFSGINISYANFPLFNEILKIQEFNYFFTIFCISIVINGVNFVDGINNNVNLYFLIFNAIMLIVKSSFNLNYDLNVILILFSLSFFILNHKNKYMFGDSGAYLIGAIIAVETINLINNIDHISKYFAIILLIYPCYETLFSLIRKIRKSPFAPDKRHIHILLYYYNKKQHLVSSCIINLFNLIFICAGYFFMYDNHVLIFLIMTYMIIYNFLYFQLERRLKLF